MATEHPARLAAHKSMQAVREKNKQAWIDLFADDAVVEDPVGESPLDPTGKGHRGKAAIAAFWDANIGSNTIDFDIWHSYACGSEVANVGRITVTMPGGMRSITEGVYTYKVNAAGKLVWLRAFWELGKTMASMQPAG